MHHMLRIALLILAEPLNFIWNFNVEQRGPLDFEYRPKIVRS